MSAFQKLLDEIRQDEKLLEITPNSERRELEADKRLEPWIDRRSVGTLPTVSEKAAELIIVFEVSSKSTYEKKYRHPIWPKGRSGITIGVGYDLGYVSAATFTADWRGNLSATDIQILSITCGITGKAAEALLPKVKQVDISFDNAVAVFRGSTLVQVAAKTVHGLRNTTELHADSFGALVSLVYNRGASFSLEGDRYVEMRRIRDDMDAFRYKLIPGRIRSMKRLWENEPGSGGLVKRREIEAVLFEEGLAQM